MKYIIVGYDRNRAIGVDGTLPWAGKMYSDMQRVKQLTTGNAIIMGRRTLESIGRALPNRQNIVISSHEISVPDVLRVSSLDEAYQTVEDGRHAYIFGGAQLYEASLDGVDEIIATEIDTVVEGADVFFPLLGKQWHEVSREHHDADERNVYPFDFVTFRKV